MRIFVVGLLYMSFLSSCNINKNLIAEREWEYLFDGKSLKGWHIKGGDASYVVDNKSIIGKSAINTANTFLCTDKMYSDFILELEFKVDSRLNSGIQIRSQSKADYNNGAVHGYQVEIDPSDRAWSAGIYDESRRGWLNNLENNPKAREAFKTDDWNHYRIEAIEDTIKTWINDVPAAHLIDKMTREGFIGLQVHDIGNDETKLGSEVQWRNVRIHTKDPKKYSRTSNLKPIKV